MYKIINDPQDGDEVQFVGVHALAWQAHWGKPAVAFVEADYNQETIEVRTDFFEHLLNCLANQKYIGEAPPNGDALAMGEETFNELQDANQQTIDDAWNDGMAILAGKDFVPRSAVLQK